MSTSVKNAVLNDFRHLDSSLEKCISIIKNLPLFEYAKDFDSQIFLTEFITLTNDVLYKGEVNFDNEPEGNGVMIAYSRVYQGRWEGCVLTGLAREVRKNGNYYEGYWVNGLKSGFGIERRRKTLYVGDWR